MFVESVPGWGSDETSALATKQDGARTAENPDLPKNVLFLNNNFKIKSIAQLLKAQIRKTVEEVFGANNRQTFGKKRQICGKKHPQEIISAQKCKYY